jgi:hypothetical protein
MVYLTNDPFGFKFTLTLCIVIGLMAVIALFFTLKHFIISLIEYCREDVIIEVKRTPKSTHRVGTRTYTFVPS